MKRWLALTAAGALVAGGAALVTTSVATAQDTPSPTATSSTDPDDPLRERLRDKLRLRFGDGQHMMGGVLHGELTVSGGDGYRTVLVHRGTATAVSADSITVRSADGFTRTYAVTDDTVVHGRRTGVSAIAEGNPVHVLASRVDGQATATRIADLTTLVKRHGGMMG